MIKLIILMAFGKKIKQTRLLSFMIKSYLLFYMLAIPITNFAQSFEWVKPYPVEYNYNPELVNYLVSVDNNNHIFWGGMFMFHENYASTAFGDLNIIKHNADGNVLTTFYAYGPGNIVNMIHDSENNFILFIDVRDDLLLDSSDTLHHSGNNISSHLVKLSPDFDLLWTKLIADNFSYSVQKGITIDADNNIYYGQNNYQDSHIIILNPEGEEINNILQENVASISSIAIDQDGNIYTAGSCAAAQPTFGGVQYNHELSYNFYIAKYNNLHQVQWVKFVEDITCQFPQIKVSDPNHVYFIGELYFSTMFDSILANGPDWVFDFFVAKLNADGEFQWVAEVPASTVIAGDASIARLNNSVIDSENNLSLSGFIRGNIEWESGISAISTNIGYDLLILKYNSEGDVIMSKHGGGESFDKTISCAIDSDDNLYLAGFGFDSIQFDNVQTYYEGYYPFLLKLNNEDLNTGIKKDELTNSIKIYPNPVRDIVNLELDIPGEESFTIKIQNLNGAVIKEFVFSNASEIIIDMSEYPGGVYFLSLHSSEFELSPQKVIKY